MAEAVRIYCVARPNDYLHLSIPLADPNLLWITAHDSSGSGTVGLDATKARELLVQLHQFLDNNS